MALSEDAETYIMSPQTPVDQATSLIIQELLHEWAAYSKPGCTKPGGSNKHRLAIVYVVLNHFLITPHTAGMKLWKSELRPWQQEALKQAKPTEKEETLVSHPPIPVVSKDQANNPQSANWPAAQRKKKNRWLNSFEAMPLINKVMHSRAIFDMEHKLNACIRAMAGVINNAIHEEALDQKPGYRAAIAQ